MKTAESRARSRDNVADQAGGKLFLVLLALSWALGSWTRSWFNPEQFRRAIETASRQVHPSLTASYSSVDLYLARSWIPELGMQVQDLVLQSSEKCWLSPSLEIRRLSLPVDVWALFRGEVRVAQALAEDTQLTFRNPPQDCPESGQVLLKKSETQQGSIFQKLLVRGLKIHYLPLPGTQLSFRDLVMKVHSPEHIDLLGDVKFLDESLASPLHAQAQMRFEYRSEAPWILSLAGRLREGQYQVGLQIEPRSLEMRWDLQTQHLSLPPLMALLQRHWDASWDLPVGSLWMNARARGQGNLRHIRRSQAKVESLSLEGDLGELRTEGLEIRRLDPPELVSGSAIDVQSLRLDPWLQSAGWSSLLPFRPGVFRGKILMSPELQLSLSGELGQSDILWSLAGGKFSQRMSLAHVSGQMKGHRLSLDLDSIAMAEGSFLGRAHVETDLMGGEMGLRLVIDDWVLPGDLQRQLFGQSLSSLFGVLQWKSRPGIRQWAADLQVNRLETPQFRAEKLRLTKSFAGQAQVKARNFQILDDSQRDWTQHRFQDFRLSWNPGGEWEARASRPKLRAEGVQLSDSSGLRGEIQIQSGAQKSLILLQGALSQIKLTEPHESARPQSF